MRFTLIDAREADLSVERACQLCEVSPSGYYAWQGRPASKHQRDDMIYLAHTHRYLLNNRQVGIRQWIDLSG